VSNVLSVVGHGLFFQELRPRDADRYGMVLWDWIVDPATSPGESTVTVTCIPGGIGSASLRVG